MREIWIPGIEKLVRLTQEKGVPVVWHCCGKLDQLLPQLAAWGINAIETIQTSCNDIYQIKKEYADTFCLMGNMNIEGVLAFGTPEEVREDTRQHIDRLAYDGGYVVSSSHSIVESIPLSNYFAMIETARTYGAYES